MRDRLVWTALFVAALSLAFAHTASAQSTGGSAGSSGFGGGSSSSSGSSSSGSSWGSSGSSGSSPSPPSEAINAATFTTPSARLGTPFLATPEPQISPAEAADFAQDGGTSIGVFSLGGCASYLIAAAAFIALALFLTRRTPRKAVVARGGSWQVRRLSVAFDWTVRAEMQQALDEITRTTKIDDDDGRRVLLERVARLMGDALSAARYAMFQSFSVDPTDAEQRFLATASDLRARFKKETRGARAVDPAPELRARADEGEGLVVVSVVGAFNRHSAPLPHSIDAASVAAALLCLASEGRAVAIEIVWSPAEELDRMSSAELELFYPELVRVDTASTGVGRLSCAYCSAVYPAEIGKCPACGAPASA